MGIKRVDITDLIGPAKVVTIFAAVVNVGSLEGRERRGEHVDQSYHLTEEGAREAGRGKGVYGGDGEAQPRLAVLFQSGEYLLLAQPGTVPTNPVPLIVVNMMSDAQKYNVRQPAFEAKS